MEQRYVATVVPRGEAVRSVGAVGADAAYELGEPPGGLPCIGSSAVLRSYGFEPGSDGAPRPPGPDEQVVAEAGGHRLLVRDAEADRLCAGVDRLRADASDCTLPAALGEEAFAFASGGVVSAVLPAEVARVRLPGGRVVETVEGGYRGRYAGSLRFLLVETDAVDGRFRMLDSAGTVIGSLHVFDPDRDSAEPPARSARLAAGRAWRLETDGECLFVTLRGADPVCGAHLGGPAPSRDGAFALVGCSPRVAVLTGTLGAGARIARVVLRDGRTLRARVVRLPRRARGDRAFVIALPRDARVKALSLGGRRYTFPLLPAADQCGYGIYAPYLDERPGVIR